MKKNFAYGTKVRIARTASIGIDGMEGRIVGVASRHIADTYIVDVGFHQLGGDPTEFSAVALPEGCLDAIPVEQS